MSKFSVIITEVVQYRAEVEADDRQKAEQKAAELDPTDERFVKFLGVTERTCAAV